MADGGSELVKAGETNNSLASVLGVGVGIYTSLDKRKPEDAMLFMRCINACDKRFEECLGTEIELADIFAHQVNMVNEDTGDLDSGTRCVLITKQRDTIECVSNGVARDLSALAYLYGDPPFPPGLQVKLVQKSVGRNRRMFTLELVSAPEVKGTKYDNRQSSRKK